MNNSAIVAIVIAVLCVLGVLAGFQVGKQTHVPSESAGSEPAETESSPSRSMRRGPGKRRELTVEDLAAKMQDALRGRNAGAWEALRNPIESLARDELLALLEELEVSNDRESREARRFVFGRLAQIDPQGALELAKNTSGEQERSLMIGTALQSWAELNPQVALQKARELASTGGRDDSFISQVFREWGRNDYDAAFAAAITLESGPDRESAIESLSNAAGADENLRMRLLEIAARLENPEQSQEFVEGAVRTWAHSAKRDELEAWVDAQEIEPGFRSALLRSVAEGAAYRDPQRTAEWLLSRSTEVSKSEDLRVAVTSWAQAQPQACGQWLERQVRGPEADLAVAEYSHMISNRNPREGLTWAQRIHNGELRNRALLDVVNRMGPIPEERVRQNLERAGLEESLVAQLLEERANR